MPRASSAIAHAKTAEVPKDKRGANARSKTTAQIKRQNYSHLQAREKGLDTGTYAGAEALDENKPLTEMQLRFVKLWAEGYTILMASVKAGYNDGGSMAYRMARMPHILRRYQLEKVKYEEAAQMTRQRVMDMLLESYQTAKMVAEPASMVSAAREIGKMCGYYEPVTVRHQVSVTGDVVHRRVERMSDMELLEYIAENQRAIAASSTGEPTSELLQPLAKKNTNVEDAVIVEGGK